MNIQGKIKRMGRNQEERRVGKKQLKNSSRKAKKLNSLKMYKLVF
jgi:hypothetical protein